ncbi:MAG: hypothetical protein V8T01_07620 [Oscillospiraceae bacterium]
MQDLVIYIHGKGGSAQEAEHYKTLFPKDHAVIGFDYRSPKRLGKPKKSFSHFLPGREIGVSTSP